MNTTVAPTAPSSAQPTVAPTSPANTSDHSLSTKRVLSYYCAAMFGVWCLYVVAVGQGAILRLDASKLPNAIYGATWGLGPAILLGFLIWPITGWLTRMRKSMTVKIVVHVAFAVAFSATWQYAVYLWNYFVHGQEDAFNIFNSWLMWQLMWGLFMYSAVAAVFHAVRAVREARMNAAKAATMEGLLAQAQLEALRGKLNPHFLFNTLHSLIALTRRRPEQAEKSLLQFSDMLRYILDSQRNTDDHVCVHEEIQFIKNYLDLEALRLGDRLKVQWQLDESLSGLIIPALMLQPLVENSIKHGISPVPKGGTLILTSALEDETVVFTIADTGPGTDPSNLEKSVGIGLQGIRKRLQLEYGPQAGLFFTSAVGEGFSAQVRIPLDKMN